MRLTCPNCGARYEVDDALIPPEGRDVQCSDCFTTWFQPGPRVAAHEAQAPRAPFPGATDTGGAEADVVTAEGEAAPADEREQEHHAQEDNAVPESEEAAEAELREELAELEQEQAYEQEPEPAPQPEPEPEPTPETAPEQKSETESDPEPEPAPEPQQNAEPERDQQLTPAVASGTDDPENPLTELPEHAESATRIVSENDLPEPEDEPETSGNAAARREIDPGVRDILRSEAEREARLRQEEAGPVETQAEMPLDAAPDDADLASRRTGLEDAEDAFVVGAASAAHANGSRRDLLPDIEEINSTLRATEDRGAEEGEDAAALERAAASRRRRGARIGFFLTLALTGALIWLYFNGDMLGERVPAIAGAVDGFTAQVDGARFWLDDLARGLAASEEDS
jgi:predicted Zn finger-like uncharacterized protein